jgi:hypothetical protein
LDSFRHVGREKAMANKRTFYDFTIAPSNGFPVIVA